MRYLPIVMGVSFIVVVKIIKNQTCAGRNGPWRGEANVACPHAEVPFPSIRHTVHKEPGGWITRHSRGEVDRGEKPPCREMTGENAVEGLDWQPLCRGCSRAPQGVELRDQSPNASPEYTTF